MSATEKDKPSLNEVIRIIISKNKLLIPSFIHKGDDDEWTMMSPAENALISAWIGPSRTGRIDARKSLEQELMPPVSTRSYVVKKEIQTFEKAIKDALGIER